MFCFVPCHLPDSSSDALIFGEVRRELTSSSWFVTHSQASSARSPFPQLAVSGLGDRRRGFSQVLTSWKVLRQDERCLEVKKKITVANVSLFDGGITNHKKDKR